MRNCLYSSWQKIFDVEDRSKGECAMELAARKTISWPAVSTLSVTHILGFAGVYYASVYTPWSIIAAAVVYFFLCHLAIAFIHRGFTHRAFTLAKPVAYATVCFFTAVLEGAALWWRGKHLDHHVFSDVSGKDPHTPRDGFFHAHMGWLLTVEGIGPPSRRSLRLDKQDSMDQVLVWQAKHHTRLLVVMLIGLPACIGWFLGDVVGGVLIIGFARLLFQQHLTWIVNSIGHTFGQRPMTNVLATNFSNWPLGLPIFGLLTVGESHHANHHKNANTWRLGTKWYHFDVAAWCIQLFIWLGLATEAKAKAQ